MSAQVAVAAPPSFAQKVRPMATMAICVTMATIWEDAIDTIPEEHVTALASDVVNALGVSLLTLGIKLVSHSLPKTKLHELINTCFQTLTAWMWKSALDELIEESQSHMAEHQFDFRSNSTEERAHNQSIMWRCQGVSFGYAVAATIICGLLLACLPVRAAPAKGSSSCAYATVAFHLTATVTGAVTLPVAYAWHFWTFNIAQSLVLPQVLEPESVVYSWSDVGLWVFFAVVIAVFAAITLSVAGLLRMLGLSRLLAYQEKGALSAGRQKRFEATLLKTFDFLVAWCTYSFLQSFYSDIDSTDCYPENTPHALKSAAPAAVFCATLLVCAICMLLVILKACKGAKADASKESLAPSAPCCRRWGAHCWAINLGTLGIMLGWSIKDSYTSLLAVIVASMPNAADPTAAIDVTCLGALCATLALLSLFSIAYGECRKHLDMAKASVPTATAATAAAAPASADMPQAEVKQGKV